jgi:hypothetical protein
MMGLKNRNEWLADCLRYIASDERWGLASWQKDLAQWLTDSRQTELAEKVRTMTLVFQEDTDLAWAHNAQTNGLMVIRNLLDVAKDRQDRIFLSHSSGDKDRVRDYYRTLKQLGYNPWLDEEAIAAGAPLERALLEGMTTSMAAVFFVTRAFKDKGYLGTEIDYAVAEKTKRGDGFAIITLVLTSSRLAPEVPELLRRFVWKRPASDLAGLREILKALPTSKKP